jgi:hypothetical protein
MLLGTAMLLVPPACGGRTGLFVLESLPVDENDGGVQSSIDPMCPGLTCNGTFTSVFPPYVPLLPPGVPASCSTGFELGDANTCDQNVYTVQASSPNGAPAITLDVDFATYAEADGVQITGVDVSGNTYTLLATCRMQTWTMGDPTGGTSRPPDETIRQFRVDVKEGTKSLTFDFSLVRSPMYLQVVGLCAFDVTQFTRAVWWQAVP